MRKNPAHSAAFVPTIVPPATAIAAMPPPPSENEGIPLHQPCCPCCRQLEELEHFIERYIKKARR